MGQIPAFTALALALALPGCGTDAGSSKITGKDPVPPAAGFEAMPAAPIPAKSPSQPARRHGAVLPSMLPGPPVGPSELRAQQEAQLQKWQTGFAREVRAPKWAQGMEIQLLGLEQPKGIDYPTATRINTECREHTCRQQFEFPQNGNIDGWLNDYVYALGPHLPAVQAIEMQGSNGNTELYVFASEN